MSSALRDFRKTKGLTLQEAAEEIGVTAATLSRLETGKSDPSLALIREIAKWSGGVVGAASWIDEHEGAPDPAEAAE